jgi:hypothetical protein
MDIQNLIRASDLRDKHVVPDIQWQRGESITYDVVLQEYGEPLEINSSATVKFQIWLAADPSTVYVNKTGTIVDAEAGELRFELTTVESALTAGTYKSQIVVQSGTKKGTFARCGLVIYANPLGGAINTVSGSFSADFTELGDTPDSYLGFGGYEVLVNEDEDGLEFVEKEIPYGDVALNLTGAATPALVVNKQHELTITGNVTSINPTGLDNGSLIWFFIINPSEFTINTSGLSVFPGLSLTNIAEDGAWGVIGKRNGVYYAGCKFSS